MPEAKWFLFSDDRLGVYIRILWIQLLKSLCLFKDFFLCHASILPQVGREVACCSIDGGNR